MATNANQPSHSEHLNCPICLEVFKSPRSLPCLHSFCGVCIESFVQGLRDKGTLKGEFECPVCRKSTQAPRSDVSTSTWVETLPANHVIVSLLDSESRSSRKICDPCLSEGKTETARGYCGDCKEYICEDCITFHTKCKATKKHKICNIGEESNVNTTEKPNQKFCQIHKDKPIEFLCQDHDALCCSTCAIVSHRKCNDVTEIQTLADQFMKTRIVDEMSKDFERLYDHIDYIKTGIEENMNELEKQNNHVERQVRIWYEKVISIATTNRDELSQQLAQSYKEESIKLFESSNECQELLSAVEKSAASLRTTRESNQDAEFFIDYKNAEEKLRNYRKQVLAKHESINKVRLEFEIDDNFETVLSKAKPGQLAVEKSDPALPKVAALKLHRDCEMKASRERILSATDDENEHFISDSIVYPDGLLAVVDPSKKQLLVFYSASGKYKEKFRFREGSEIPLRILPWDENDVGVLTVKEDSKKGTLRVFGTCSGFPEKYSIDLGFEKIIDITQISKDRLGILKVEEDNTTASVLVIPVGKRQSEQMQVENLDIDGGEESIPLLRLLYGFRRFSFLVNCGSRLVCVGIKGGIKYTYRSDTLEFITDTAMDREGNVYLIAGKGSNCFVRQLDVQGIFMREVKLQPDIQPMTICFNGEDAFFVVFGTETDHGITYTLLDFKLV